MIAQLVLRAISSLENIGIYVDGIICDGATTNRKMWKELGIDSSKNNLRNYFQHPCDPKRKVYAFSDFVHLFKCVRNRLYNNKCLQVNYFFFNLLFNNYLNNTLYTNGIYVFLYCIFS